MNKAILFDFDGVLVDSLDMCFETSIEANNIPKDLEFYRRLFDGNIFDGLKKYKKPTKNKNMDFYSVYGPKLMKLGLNPNAEKMLKILSKQHLLFIVSATPGKLIETFFKKQGVLKYFKEILGSDLHKSKVYKINYALKKFKLLPQNCLFVTDTLGDILEARKCGVPSIAVTGGFHLKRTLLKGKPIKVIGGLRTLPKEINKYFKNSGLF